LSGAPNQRSPSAPARQRNNPRALAWSDLTSDKSRNRIKPRIFREAGRRPGAAEDHILGLNAESSHSRDDDCDDHNDKRQRKRVIVAVVNRDRCLYRGVCRGE